MLEEVRETREKAAAAVAKAVSGGGHAPEVLYMRASKSSLKVKNSEGSVLGEMLKELGAVNIADSETGLLENLSMEAVLQADPEYIFLVFQGTDPSGAEKYAKDAMLSNPAWQSLSAVQNGKVFTVDQKLYNFKPNARWGEACRLLYDMLYGDGERG